MQGTLDNLKGAHLRGLRAGGTEKASVPLVHLQTQAPRSGQEPSDGGRLPGLETGTFLFSELLRKVCVFSVSEPIGKELAFHSSRR